jgi:hypothetical protein
VQKQIFFSHRIPAFNTVRWLFLDVVASNYVFCDIFMAFTPEIR